VENNNGLENINMFKYLFQFTILTLLTIFSLRYLEIFSDYKEVILECTLILVIPALYTVFKFIKENKRAPNKSEKKKLTYFSVIILWLILGH